ncbi:MAG: mucoidy inhibitor MuiA family protein, partial [Candidatus Krumholzibacteriia bacterium]
NESSEQIEIAYNAKIQQATGEDWKDVAVLLSTAEPQVGAAPPALLPITVALYEGASAFTGSVLDARTGRPLAYANVVLVGTKLGAMTQSDGTYRIVNVPAGAYEVKAMMMGYRASVRRGVLVSPGRDVYANFALEETTAGRTQEIVVEAESSVSAVALKSGIVRTGGELHVRGGRSPEMQRQIDGALSAGAEVPPPPETPSPLYFEQAGIASGEFTANLQIKMPLDLESGAEPKRALIVRERLGGTVSRHAVPSLSERVFLEGTFKNSLAVPLLPGIAEVYIETTPPGASNLVSTFVGREAIVGVAPEQTFAMHLGIDQSMKVSHKLEKKEYLSKAGRKTNKVRYQYLITLESFRKDSSTIRVEDRIPTSTNADIKVTDVEIEPVPTEQQDNGLLTWKVPLAPGEIVSIRTAYTIAFPADRVEREIMFRE